MIKEDFVNLCLTEPSGNGVSNSPLDSYLSRYITDSTSLSDAVVIVESGFQELCAGTLNIDELDRFIQAEVDETDSDIDDQLQQGLDIFHTWSEQKVVQICKANNTNGNLAIHIGKVLLKLKEIANKIKTAQWEDWAAENINLKDGTRQLYMQLAKRPDCHPYSYLGVSYLRELLAVTSENSDDVLTITQLFDKYDILDAVEPNPDETTVGEFKRKVSAAIAVEKLLKKGVTVDFDKIYPLYAMGNELTSKHIEEIESLADDPVRVNEYIDDLIHNQGIPSRQHESQPNYDITSDTCCMCEKVDYVLDKDDLVAEIYLPAIQDAIFKLRALEVRCQAVQSC